ncbi:MAG: amidase family protein, partial [Acidobacteriota bacterium]|nr:amidase family protein [Acidobacteriota bacterium]
MKRREFLETAALASTAAAAALTCGDMKNVSAQTNDDFELSEMTVMQLQDAMKSGRWSSEKITEKYLDRIRSLDRRLNSVIEVNPDAEQIAAEMDKERKNGRVRSPLHGIPVLLKDNIDTADRMKTTAGSLALVDAPTPRQDAFLVRQLRKAGAVVIGKTNLSEWANFRSTKSSSGWSARGGQTRNPYVLDRNP